MAYATDNHDELPCLLQRGAGVGTPFAHVVQGDRDISVVAMSCVSREVSE